MFKKTVITLMIIGLILNSTLLLSRVQGQIAISENQELVTEAKSYLLGEPNSGEILQANNERQKVYPASITKIMTLILVMEALQNEEINLNDEVVVPREAEGVPGTTIFLQQNEKITVEELIKGVAVGSANDAAIAIAKHISGTVDKFVEEMNEKATELNMTDTQFQNPHGLHHKDHYSSARDIFIMAKELTKYPNIHDWLSIWMIEDFLQGKKVVEDKEEGVYLSNTNRLIHEYPGCDGFKTGYTDESKHSIAATAERDGERYIAIIMGHGNSDGRFEDAMTLLDYAFANYQTIKLLEQGEPVARVKVAKGKVEYTKLLAANNLALVLKEGSEDDIKEEYSIPEQISPPINKGERIGDYTASAKGKTVSVSLIADATVEEAGMTDFFAKMYMHWLQFWSSEK